MTRTNSKCLIEMQLTLSLLDIPAGSSVKMEKNEDSSSSTTENTNNDSSSMVRMPTGMPKNFASVASSAAPSTAKRPRSVDSLVCYFPFLCSCMSMGRPCECQIDQILLAKVLLIHKIRYMKIFKLNSLTTALQLNWHWMLTYLHQSIRWSFWFSNIYICVLQKV